MSCDFLQGLDIDALSPPESAVEGPVLLADGLGTAPLTALFPASGAALAGRMRRCPQRTSNQHWQAESLRAAVQAVVAGEGAPVLGVARQAIEEFRHFWLAKLEGVLRHDVRYVVALPTAYTLLASLAPGADVLTGLPPLEAALRDELRVLLEALPAGELAIQWDACGETRLWETRGRDLSAPRGLPERLLESFVTLCEAVPVEAELGFHFCHRAAQGQTRIEPTDSGQVSRLVGALIASIERQPQFVHVPVPAGRDDTGYFEPLANLALWPAMDLHLALLHDTQDADVAARQQDAAQRVLRRFGIAPACGVDPQAVLGQLEQLLAREPGAAHLS